MSVTPLRPNNDAVILQLPANTEAEQALLGAILVDNVAYSRVAEFLAAEHFSNAVHGRIYAAIGKLIERGQIADPVILKHIFDQDGVLAEIGGAQYLARLAEAAITIINAEHYGRTIHNLYLRREIIALADDIATSAYSYEPDDRPAAGIAAEYAQRLLDIRRKDSSKHFIGSLSVAAWAERQIPEPDFLLGEILSTTSRQLLVATTGLGKTNLAIAMGFAMALGQDFLNWRVRRPTRVLYVDGEMSKRLVKGRLADAARRAGAIPETFFVICRDDIEHMPPLNTPEGQHFIDDIIEKVGGVDFVILDNIQALLLSLTTSSRNSRKRIIGPCSSGIGSS